MGRFQCSLPADVFPIAVYNLLFFAEAPFQGCILKGKWSVFVAVNCKRLDVSYM